MGAKRTFVISDIHGMFEEFEALLQKLKVQFQMDIENSDDVLVLLGDYIDRGPHSFEVVDKIQKLQKRGVNIVALKGNHELMLYNAFTTKGSLQPRHARLWHSNGGYETEKSFWENNSDAGNIIDWISSLPLYHEDKNYVYVHAGINPAKELNAQTEDYCLWARDDFLLTEKNFAKPVVFGHTPSIHYQRRVDPNIDTTKPYVTPAGNIGIDTGGVFGGVLTALIIQEDGTYSHVSHKVFKQK